MCHVVLSLPLFALPLFYFLPFRSALPAYLAVLVFTWFVYLKTAAVMRAKVRTGKEGLIGEEALVLEEIDPEGKIMVWSEIWAAASSGKRFQKGQKVVITGFQRLTAIVEEPSIECGRV